MRGGGEDFLPDGGCRTFKLVKLGISTRENVKEKETKREVKKEN
jgi:hypothetical protein